MSIVRIAWVDRIYGVLQARWRQLGEYDSSRYAVAASSFYDGAILFMSDPEFMYAFVETLIADGDYDLDELKAKAKPLLNALRAAWEDD